MPRLLTGWAWGALNDGLSLWFTGRRRLFHGFGSPSTSFGTRKCDYFKRIPWFSSFGSAELCRAGFWDLVWGSRSGRTVFPGLPDALTRFLMVWAWIRGLFGSWVWVWQGSWTSGLRLDAFPYRGWLLVAGSVNDVAGLLTCPAWAVLREAYVWTYVLWVHWCGWEESHLLEWETWGRMPGYWVVLRKLSEWGWVRGPQGFACGWRYLLR